jgi:hypothetical protein
MNEIIQALLSRLCKKGLTPEEIPWLIRDFLNTVDGERHFTMDGIAGRLSNLGWSEEILDQFTFELMLSFLENENGFQFQRSALH